ncbi:MAG: hypothetical protein II379_00515 [Oscillospiraceae bacterium]|nr:hypothetical protein [Oscillospiraceae bacterium]
MKQRTHELALASMLGATAVVLLMLGGIIPLSTFACPVLSSFAILIAGEECRKSYAWTCYAASAILGLLLGPDKESALLFVFLGYYPLLQPKLDALRPAPVRMAVKLALAITAVGAMYALILFVFRLEAVVQEFYAASPAVLWSTIALGLLLFLVYDLALHRLGALYRYRRRKQ